MGSEMDELDGIAEDEDALLSVDLDKRCSFCDQDDEDYVVGGEGYTICKRCFAQMLTASPTKEHHKCILCGCSGEDVEINQNLGVCLDDVEACKEAFQLTDAAA
jgi:hypothetical protein